MGLSIVRSQNTRRSVVPPDWRSLLDGLSDDIRDVWEERAAIIEYDGGEPRPTAERRAFECLIADFESVAILVQAQSAGRSTRNRQRGVRAAHA